VSGLIRVFLVDDHEIVRQGVASLLTVAGGIDVVGEAGTAEQARSRISATRPDVAVLDVRLPDGNGIDLCRDILSLYPEMRCLILTAYDDDRALAAAVVAGASGYVLKNVRGSGLVDSVRAVAAGKSLIAPALARQVVSALQARVPVNSPLAVLNERERSVVALIAEGLTNRQIGLELSLAEKTVKNYVSSVLSKLGLQRRTQAVVLHLENS